ncbi:MAG: helix-turn-helix domain-containing protein [Caldilineaceae bacterium]
MTPPTNETSERILDAAEALFMARGYDGVKLRDIAEAVGMRHALALLLCAQGQRATFCHCAAAEYGTSRSWDGPIHCRSGRWDPGASLCRE